MRIVNGEVFTTTELMVEFFGMSSRLINSITEQGRYEKIYQYLMENGAEELEGNQKYQSFKFKGDAYLIPKEIFDERDLSWTAGLKASEEKELINNKNEKRVSYDTKLRLVY